MTAYGLRISGCSSDWCSSDLMRVRLGLAVRAHVPMHIEVGHPAAFDELLLDELAGELDALLLVQLARNRELDFAGKLRVLALLAGLHLVPQGRAKIGRAHV